MFIYNVKINGGIALKAIIIFLSVFMLIVFGISVYRIFFSSGKFKINDRVVANDITEIEGKNYANILQAVHKNLKEYEGMKIKFTGYVYRVIDFKENQFVLARDMFINDEKTRTVIIGFLSEYDDIKNIKECEWVEITGIIKKGQYHNKEVPIIEIIDLQVVLKPEEAFVMPSSDTYIPTNGVL